MARKATATRKTKTDLENRIAELEEVVRDQERFVAHLAHELKAPLSMILVSLEVLERENQGRMSQATSRQFEILYRSTRSLLGLTDNMLDFYKLQRGGLAPQAMPVRVDEFVRDLSGELEPLFHKKNLYLRSELAPDCPSLVMTDPEILSRILLNLLINAYKYTERGGATLRVQAESGLLRFAVSDTGLGIPGRELKAIFEEFRRLSEMDARRRPGTGLGLPIASRFAELLGGRIEVESTEGQGSRFSVVLPLDAIGGA